MEASRTMFSRGTKIYKHPVAGLNVQEPDFLLLSPNGRYKGQNPIKLVRINAAATTKRMIATVPEITFVKYNTIIAMAARIRITLSSVPMFFIIIYFFKE